MPITLLIRIPCRHCGQFFDVCQCCWRGQAYCSDSCRITARRQARRKAQKRYRQTEKGKENHRLAEQQRRIRKTLKSVDDQSSTPSSPCATLPDISSPRVPGNMSHPPRCHFCGTVGDIVSRFPDRGYGRRHGPREHRVNL